MTENSSPEAKPPASNGQGGADAGVGSVEEALADYPKMLREKILFGLSVYPFIGRSMLHQFLQTSTPAGVWKPVLAELIAEGLVIEEEVTLTSPHDRTQTYNILHLSSNPYTPPEPIAPATSA